MKFFQSKYLALLLLFFTACRTDTLTTLVNEWDYFCNAEISNEKGTFLLDSLNPSIHYRNIGARTNEESYSGKYSLRLCGDIKFGFTIDLKNLKKDEYIYATAWRKSKDENGVIAASGNKFYTAGSQVIEKGENGWEKISHEFFVPLNVKDKVTIYVWNNGADTVYFDNFRISRKPKKIYPGYNIESAFKLFYDERAQEIIDAIRYDAFERGMLIVEEDDYVNAIVFSDNDFFESKIRLKGDWLDHIQGDKLSFRIKPKTGSAWRGMTEFSIQTPPSRNFQHEWVLHEMLLNNDLLTTRYGFIPVYVNGMSKGIYAWEEHFEKQLVENNNRREGPIVRFDETLFWERTRIGVNEKRALDVPYYHTSVVTPFNQNKTITDPQLKSEFAEALSLMHQIQFRKSEVSEIFDTPSLASFFAYTLLNKAFHGIAWHNMRFYYNPVLCRLEPITFDGGCNEIEFDDRFMFSLPDTSLYQTSCEVLHYWPLRDPAYLDNFYDCLNKITSDTFINNQFRIINDQLINDENLLKEEFSYYSYSNEHILEKAKQMRSMLPNFKKIIADSSFYKLNRYVKYVPTELSDNYYEELIRFQIHVFTNEDANENLLFEVENFFGDTIIISGGKPVGEPFNIAFDQPIIVAPIEEPYLASSYQVSGNFEEVTVEIPSANKTITVQVIPWQAPKALSSRQEVERHVKFPQTEYYSLKEDNIEFSGEVHINSHLIIPTGYKVVFKPGAQIDITDSATFVSYSPVYFEGTQEKPVLVISSDRSARGFNVLQAKDRSLLKHAIFDGISNLSFGGWVTPCAVCFYESDVDMQWVTFRNNSNCDDALNVVRSNFKVENCRFENTFADAFDSDFCTGTLTNSVFEYPGNDAIDFSGSQISISNCTINNPGDKGISGGENSLLVVTKTNVTGANIGVASKDLSTVTLRDCKVEGCAYGMTAYVKKPEYGPAIIIANNCDFRKNLLLHLIEEESVLKFNNRTINGTARKLAERFY
ncbi:MAG: right-handed parallel beta-helix repeat-containing protein [Prolixibacteraceae bacterium]|nr:right-handed parallel beta-helix repeat-containing protein [Prolixibacteraceae bacterium]